MFEKLGVVDFVDLIKNRLTDIGIPVFKEKPPSNTEGPFLLVNFLGSKNEDTDYTLRDRYSIWIHCITRGLDGNEGLYNLIDMVREKMDDVVIPSPFELVRQTNSGVQTIDKDEVNNNHSVVQFEFLIAYGTKRK